MTFRGDPNPVGPLKVISPLISYQGQRMWEKKLARLKSTLEAKVRKDTSLKRRSNTARVRGSGKLHEAVALWCWRHSSW